MQSNAPPTDESLWRIVVAAVAGAPRRTKWTLLWNLMSAVFVIVVVVVDLVTGTSPQEISRLVAVVLGMAGLSILAAAYVLHHASQQTGVSCARLSFFRLESQVLDRIFLALPAMATASGVLLAFALGLFVPSLIAHPIFLIVVALFGYYLVLASRTVSHTSRFLYRHAQEQAEAAAKARGEATEAHLAALQAQMNPHFLFNALNTVASLVRTDGEAAEATVENLAEVLRRTLDRSRNGSGTVREEIDYLKAYLAVEQERWGERLRVNWAVEPGTLDLPLPPMTLQPLVENALKHGIGARLEGGVLRIATARQNGVLTLEVSDDGVGFPSRHREGTGLGNLRQRLVTLYGERARLRIDAIPQGSRVVVELPLTEPGPS